MKKIFLISFTAIAVTVVGVLNVSLAQNKIEGTSVSLGSGEALSACEVSSNASDNEGYCERNYEDTADVCTKGGSSSVCCSGNL
ncbi:MAG: hypothetical protein LBJ17_01550 [Dysgonamonadaceae bacterium]|nr:hypothetical protein [Dysgonamonadaceae bacterium]